MLYSYRIEQALRAASVLHKDQVRKGRIPFPYVTHLFAVALLVADYTKKESTVIAALLHDSIKETDYTPQELKKDFGKTVEELVLSISEKHEEDDEDWKARKDRYAKQLANASEEALVIAAADKIHDMRSVIEEYFDRHTRFMVDFGGTLREQLLMYQEISNILNRRLKNDIIHEFNHVFSEYKNFIAHAEEKTEGGSGKI